MGHGFAVGVVFGLFAEAVENRVLWGGELVLAELSGEVPEVVVYALYDDLCVVAGEYLV